MQGINRKSNFFKYTPGDLELIKFVIQYSLIVGLP